MYCLSWDSYKNNICNGFAQLQQKEEFVDMTLVAEGHLVNVHKNLISLASPYIKNVIKSVPCKHPIIFLTNITHDVLCQLLEYIYTGEVHVEIDKLNDFVKAAKELQLPSITNDLLHETNLSEEKSNNAAKTLLLEKHKEKLHIEQNSTENRRLDCATNDAANTTEVNDIILDIDMELSENVNDHILLQGTSLVNGQSTNTTDTFPAVNDIQLLENRLQDNGTSEIAIDTNNMANVLDINITSSQNDDNNHYDYSNSIIVTEVDNANNFDEFLKFPDPFKSTVTVNEHSVPDQQIKELEVMDHTKKAQLDLSLDGGTNSLLQQYSVSNRGSLQMVLNRYLYNMHYSAYGGVKRRWRCIDYRILRCGAFVDTHNDEIIKRKNCHTHPFHDNKIMKKMKANLIFRAINAAINQSKKNNCMEESVNISDSDD